MKIVSMRQREVYEFIVKFIKSRGYSPTIRDIANRFGLSSPASVHKYLVTLEEAGLIVRGKRNSLIQICNERDLDQEIRIPVLGQITAGQPIVWFEGAENRPKS
jgi:repressor LexA